MASELLSLSPLLNYTNFEILNWLFQAGLGKLWPWGHLLQFSK